MVYVKEVPDDRFHTGAVVDHQVVGAVHLFANADNRALAAGFGVFKYPSPGGNILYCIE